MIVVIADDLTGAAEIGGVGLRHGLTVEIVTATNASTKVDLLVVCTDTRSMSEHQAVQVTKEVITQLQLQPLQPQFIYKKIDSVLRGHILPEIEAILELSPFQNTLIIGGNPSLGRTVENGLYYLHGEPVHLSSFARDPEFPVGHYDVSTMLRDKKGVVQKRSTEAGLPKEGIVVGDITNIIDFKRWAEAVNWSVLLAGTSLFFSAVLAQNGFPLLQNEEPSIALQTPALFVCGTTFHNSVNAVQNIVENDGPVAFIPTDFLLNERNDEQQITIWIEDVNAMLLQYKKGVIAFHQESLPKKVSALQLRSKMAFAICKLFEKTKLKELVIEGGSTAAAIINELSFYHFLPTQELLPGVIRMQVEAQPDLFITMKPGSYPWPPNFWNFPTRKNELTTL